MNTLTLAPWSPDLANTPLTYPDFLIHRLAMTGRGCIEAELLASPGDVTFRYTPRGGDRATESASFRRRDFRAVLARFSVMCGTDLHFGSALFAAHPDPAWRKQSTHRFSLFFCNEPAMAIWLKLYLYTIDDA